MSRCKPSTQSATLTFDLEFDTAEEPDPANAAVPVNVRTKTAVVRQFTEPGDDPKKPPPLMQFLWGTFSFVGIVGVLVMGWVMEKSFSSVVDLILSDTGWIAAEPYPEDLPEPGEVPEEGEDEGRTFALEE